MKTSNITMSTFTLTGIENDGKDNYNDTEPKDIRKEEEEPETKKEDPSQRIKTEQVIRLMYYHFPEELKQYKTKITKLDKLSLEDLELLLQEIDVVLSMQSQYERLSQMFIGALKVLEEISKITPINLTGFTERLDKIESIKKDIALVLIRACRHKTFTPELRLASAMAMLAFDTYMVNRTNEQQNKSDLNAKLDSQGSPVISNSQISIQNVVQPNDRMKKLNENFRDLD
jgi:hypothetical protein